MKNTIIYIHGQGGSSEEAQHYKTILKNSEVIGLDYISQTPWEAKEEFPKLFKSVCGNGKVTLIANSIGAFFAMNALKCEKIEKAYFISPVVDMEKLILDMMKWASVSEGELSDKGRIETAFGQTLSWEYLCYVRENPIEWNASTDILYGEKDNLTSLETISDFVEKTGATLTVMKNGEHWFHTQEQMTFLDKWLIESLKSKFNKISILKQLKESDIILQ